VGKFNRRPNCLTEYSFLLKHIFAPSLHPFRNRENSRDTRPKALQKVSKGLRLRISSLVDNLEAHQELGGTFNTSDESLTRQNTSLEAWQTALAQSPLSTLKLSEQVALLLPIMEGYATPALVQEIQDCGVTAELPFVKALLEAEPEICEKMERTHDVDDDDLEVLKETCRSLLRERYGGVGQAHIPL
jgi:F0F1-type ATP synthase alpha subunit